MRILRLSKAMLAAAIAFTCTPVAFGNVVDPAANLTFLRHVMAMDTIAPGASIRERAVTGSGLQDAAFAGIVAAEALTALLCWIGAARMALASAGPPARFAAAKAWAVAGLTLGFLLWQAGFLGIGGEWFAMWMSKEWNAQAEAFRFAVTLLGVLVYVALPEGDP